MLRENAISKFTDKYKKSYSLYLYGHSLNSFLGRASDNNLLQNATHLFINLSKASAMESGLCARSAAGFLTSRRKI